MSLKSYERHGVLNSGNHSNLRFSNSRRRGRLYSIPLLSSGTWEALFRLAVLGLILLSVGLTACACGPFFPNNLLGGGDQPLLAAPLVNFERELMRLKLGRGPFNHISQTTGYEQQTFDGELTDLKEALRKAKISPEEAARIIEGHRANREKLKQYVEALKWWDADSIMKLPRKSPTNPKPTVPQFDDVPGLPAEFAEYFAGALAFRNPAVGVEEARNSWQRLLARPTTDREYKSVWAAFMLGKSWEEKDDDKAVEYFQQTRDLAKRGFADSIGLAAAALGLEARVELRRKNFQRAIELYLEQYAAGDSSAAQSLQVAAQSALEGNNGQLEALASTEITRRIITAYLISSAADNSVDDDAALGQARAWLEVMESVGADDMTSVEPLALMAYQRGEFEIAERWLKRAQGSPAGYWLQAKLCLRAGKVSQAAALLTRVMSLFPVPSEGEATKKTEFVDSLLVIKNRRGSEYNSARQEILGELGVLRLSRGEFAEALDALLRSGYWEDAAYVAERVLTLDELKGYVDSNWPAVKAEASGADAEVKTLSALEVGADVRYLLARRLTRESRGNEAREYFSLEWQARLDGWMSALNDGWNESLPAGQRAKALFTAACIARTNGMELLGTELAPDWFIRGGDFDFGLTLRDRETNGTINVATDIELNRARQHGADPEVRFHYRYQAASLAWEAAKLMPDDSDETARVLCLAGTWLKTRDPETADLFYKSLVRRCRRTAIGEQADRMRWFPVLDESGNPKPFPLKRETLENESTDSGDGWG